MDFLFPFFRSWLQDLLCVPLNSFRRSTRIIQFRRAEFGLALFMILKGLVQETVHRRLYCPKPDRPGICQSRSYSGFENLMGLYGYSLQVYCDFSGYTDIATGLALADGISPSAEFQFSL